MSGHTPKLNKGPITYEVSGNVHGGKLVAIDGTTKKIKQNTVADGKVLGVAATDAQAATDSDTSTDSFGNANINASLHSPYTAVYRHGVHRLVNSGSPLAWGDYVVADNAGGVRKAVIGTDTHVIGEVVNVDGAATGESADVELFLGNQFKTTVDATA